MTREQQQGKPNTLQAALQNYKFWQHVPCKMCRFVTALILNNPELCLNFNRPKNSKPTIFLKWINYTIVTFYSPSGNIPMIHHVLAITVCALSGRHVGA